jgi:putative ABC transport system permease protein
MGRYSGDFFGEGEMKRTFPAVPQLSERILRFLYSQDYYSERSGDLEEVYAELVEEYGPFRAKAWLWFQILKICVGVFRMNIIWRFIMFKNYLKITLRNIRKNVIHSSINISGLSIGLACSLLIMLWVQHELSYDRFHENADRLYRVVYSSDDGESYGRYLPGPLAAYLREHFPEINNATSFKSWEMKIAFNKKSFSCIGSYINPSFFSMFSFPFEKGEPKAALSVPNSVVITKNLAAKLFGRDDPMGKTVSYNNGYSDDIPLAVTGILKDIPQNSHLQFDFLVPVEILYDWMNTWRNKNVFAYVLLEKNTIPEEVNQKISGVLKAHKHDNNLNLYLQPIKRVHLHALGGGGRITYVYTFSMMALLVLLIACINFMNLSTAQSEQRFKEIGIKKVVGSSRFQLVTQFLCESMILSLLSLLLAAFIAVLFLPSLNSMLGTQIDFKYTPNLFLSMIGIALFTGVVSGSYPAFFLSSFHPVPLLKGNIPFFKPHHRKGKFTEGKSRSPLFRKTLVIIQFALSVGFIGCILFINQQLHYLRNKDLGFDKENVLVLRVTRGFFRKASTIEQELLNHPRIQSISSSGLRIDTWESSDFSSEFSWTGKTKEIEGYIGQNWVSYDFLKTLNLEMAEGRFFSPEFSRDPTDAVILNETAVRIMEINEPLGKEFIFNPGSTNERKKTIIGVIKDYHTESLHKEIRPFVLELGGGIHWYIRLQKGHITETLSYIERKIKEIIPGEPFDYTFLDEELDRLYKNEQLLGHLVRYGTFLVLLISSVGMFSLASFSIVRRTKEIGIRKLLGASGFRIMFILTKDLINMIFFSIVAAWPIVYFLMKKWLNSFAYRISLSVWIFLLSGLMALTIALLTVSYQSIKAATANPVDSLRYE